MNKLLGVILVLVFAGASQAQEIRIRGGEHPDHSRIVLEFDETVPQWQLGRVEGGYLLRFSEPGLAIETGDVFQRMSRERIRAVEYDGRAGELTLDVECDCHAAAFEFRETRLVIDVKTGLPPDDSPFEEAVSGLGDTSSENTRDRPANGLQATAPAPAGLLGYEIVQPHPPAVVAAPFTPAARGVQINLPLRPSGGRQSALLPPLQLNLDRLTPAEEPAPSPGASDGDQPMASREEDINSPASRRREIEDLAANEISRAIAQGLLQPVSPVETDSPEAAQENAEASVEVPVAVEPPPRIRVTTSADRDLHMPPANGTGNQCGLGTRITIRNWGDADAPYRRVRGAFASLLNEFDQIDEQAANAQIRALLYAGFGAEAGQQADWFGAIIRDRPALDEISLILDEKPVVGDSVFSGMEHCANSAAMWAVLGNPGLIMLGDVNHQAVVAEAGGMPLHLRRILVPRLETWFAEKGDHATAQALRNTLGRAGENYDRIPALSGGDGDEAERQLQDSLAGLALSGQEIAPLALIRLLDRISQSGAPPPAHLTTLAEAYIVELGDTETGTSLLAALIRAKSMSDQPEEAVALLDSRRGLEFLGTEVRAELWETVVGELTERAEDAAFLRFVYRHRAGLQALALSVGLRHVLARRLADLGMAQMARDMLAHGLDSDETRRVYAYIALAEGDAAAALGWIEGDSNLQATDLRIRALNRLGRYGELSELTGDADVRMSYLWRSGDWESLRDEASLPDLRAAAETMLRDSGAEDGFDPQSQAALTKAAALLERSAQNRRMITDLSTRFIPPDTQ